MKRELRAADRRRRGGRSASLVDPGNSIAYRLVGRRPSRKEASR